MTGLPATGQTSSAPGKRLPGKGGLVHPLLLVLALFVCLSGSPASAGDPPGVGLTAEERAWLAHNPDKLTLYFSTDFPPIEFASTSGEFTGMGADLIALVEKQLGIRFIKRPAQTWNQLLAALASGECAVAPTIVRTAERERYALFTAPYATVPVVLITTRAIHDTISLNALPGRRLGAVSGFVTEHYLRDLAQGRFEVVPVANVAEGLRKLSFGELDAFAENLAVAAYSIEQDGLPNLRVAGNTDYVFALSIGVNRSYPLLYSSIQKALAAVPPAELEQVRRRWISLRTDSLSPETRRLLWLIGCFTIMLLLGLAGISYVLKRRLNQQVDSLKTAQQKILEQAELLQLAIDTTQAAVWDLQPSRGILHLGAAGHCFPDSANTADHFVALDTWQVMIHPEDMPHLRDAYRDYLRSGGKGLFEIEFRLRSASGDWRWVLSKGKAVAWDEQGQPSRLIGLDIDIEELKKAQEAMRRSEARFRSLFAMAPVPLASASRDGRILMVNDRFTQILGYTLADLPTLEQWWLLAYPDPQYRHEVRQHWQTVAQQALHGEFGMISGEFRVTCKDGIERIMLIGAASIGEVLHVSFFDITEHKRAEEVLDRERTNLRAIVHASPVAVLVFDSGGRVVDANRAVERLFALTSGQWRGGTWGDLLRCPNRLVHPQGCGHAPDCVNCVFSRAIRETITGSTPARDREAEAVLDVPGSAKRLWLRFSIEPFELNGQPHVVMALDDLSARRQAEEALRASEAKLRSLFAAMQDVILVLDANGRYLEIAPTDPSLLCRPPEGLLGKTLAEVFPPEKAAEFLAAIRTVLDNGKRVFLDYTVPVVDGRDLWFAAIVAPLAADRVVLIARDITDRKRAEEERGKLQEQLMQSQKLEAVGILAGGVAHDFNNMLGAIIGYTELTLGTMEQTDPLRRNLQRILDAAERSAALTRQLLAFARKQTVAPVILDLNESVAGMLKMLRRLIGENITLAWLPGPLPCTVRIDPTQLDQLLANLCVNARDAIGENIGTITIKTATVSLDETFCRAQASAAPGEYVLLAVSDDGCGMDKATMDHIFEPFFTTKELGQGTGLGLATVYGIVTQNEGFITAASEPGTGTTFTVHLPYQDDRAEETAQAGPVDIPISRGETILLVEDDPTLLDMSTMMLHHLGYTVLPAATPSEALRLAQDPSARIDLFLTDVVMPEMNGRELAERLQTVRPAMRHLFMSGYTSNVIAHRGILDEGLNFIQKPFSLQELATKIRTVLDEPQP